MRIKSIKLQGFKSFVQEKEIFLPGGMTAIVGPNGCGKSNIVDAICWVLGEQSPKRLRGKKMEEILFNGSEHFSPAGMARVSLQLVKKEKGFPHPYSGYDELSVERILFRTGESEYRINQNPVRLKDIVDLFMDTGTSTRAYSIIEQGYIGEIINAGPEKLRFFIEGAAGIQKYKARKESASRKMAATQENIRHIEAILFEIRRQMNSLKRQAQKALRYKKVKDEIRRLECSLAFQDYRFLAGQEGEEEGKRKESERQNTHVSSELRREDAAIETIKTDLIQGSKEAEQKQKNLWDHIQQLNQLENRQIYLNQSRVDLTNTLDENGKSLIVTQEQLRQAESQKAELTNKGLELSRRESWLEEVVKESKSHYEILVAQEKELQQSVEERKESLFVCMTRKAELHNKQLTLQEKEKDLDQRQAKSGQEITQLKIEKEELLGERGRVERSLEKWQRNRGLLALERTALESYKEELRGRFDELSKEVEKIQEVLNRKRSRFHSLQEVQQNYEGCQDGVRAIMKTRDREEEHIGGIRGMVADFIETEPEYEVALESALGDRLQYIVVEEHQVGLQAVEYLKNQTLGRGSFIPLHLRGGENRKHPIHSPGVAMMDVVRARDEYQEIVEHLLGDVVLVPDLKDGISLWRKNGSYNRIVTREGDLIDPHGVISGGKINGSESTVFKTKREIKELKAEVEMLDREFRAKQEESDRLLRKIRFNEGDLERLQQKLYQFDIEILKGEKDVQQINETLKRNQQRLEVLEAETRQYQAEFETWKEREEEYAHQQQDLDELQVSQENTLARLNRNLKELTAERELSRDELNEREFEGQLIQEKRLGFETHKRQIEQKIHDVNIFLQEKEEERKTAEKKICLANTEISTNEEKIREIAGLREELEADLSGVNDGIENQKAILNQKEEKVKGLRRELEDTRRVQDDVQLKLVEIRMKKENLQSQIWQKHRIDITQEQDLDLQEDLDEQVRENLDKLYVSIEKMGEINPTAIEEFEDLQNRHHFYQEQFDDLNNSMESLQRLIQRINRITRSRFMDAYEGINKKFQHIFPILFNGGRAFLQLVDEKNPLESGVQIAAQPPGKKLQNINLFSGGEKTMAALSFVLAIYQYKPSPFCVLDEVDAALDDMNVVRFNDIIRDISETAQFILITHNKQTMEVADTLYGITMESPGVSQVVSVTMQ